MTDAFHRLDAETQTLVFAVRAGLMPEAVYWGPRLDADEDLAALDASQRMDLGGGSLDASPPLSLCPLPPFPGQPGLILHAVATCEADRARPARDASEHPVEAPCREAPDSGGSTDDSAKAPARGAGQARFEAGRPGPGGPMAPDFRIAAVETAPGALAFRAEDPALGLRYTARFDALGAIIRASATLESDRPLFCHWLAAPALPAPQAADSILDWSGTWLREFNRQSTPWSQGARLREARTGRSGHEHPPVALIPSRAATKTAGTVHALQLAWSGGHRFVAEELPDGRRQLQCGKASGSEAPATRFHAADLLLAVSEAGEAGIAAAFQRHLRDHVIPWPDPARPRPVHYNCWEAVYFDHSLATLAAIAERAAALGAERFVLDDGWFGRRDDDASSLGDWVADRRKWPDGLTPLIDTVERLGMRFGLWVEPEMVNQDSDLFRARPDWVLGPAEQLTGRNQLVLDLARKDVGDYLFAALDALLRGHAIDYLKWDHNRVLPSPDARQTEGVYALLARLRAAHPGVEIESCASGGGRIDAGILAQTHRVWLSDSNDALERLRIQHEAALFLPIGATGSHVGPRHCHSSGRALPMAFRAWVAAQRHMGFEMDPRELTNDEAETLSAITGWWKATRDWRMGGVALPLDSDDPSLTSEIQIAADGARFVLFSARHATPAQALPRPLRLAGLDPQARYRLRLVNPEDRPPQARGRPALMEAPLTLSGRALMTAGVQLPLSWPATMWVVEGERL